MSGKALAMSNTELAFAGLETTLAFTSVGDSLLSIANKNYTMLTSNSPAIAGYAAGQLGTDAILAYVAPKGLNLSGKTLKNIGGRTFGMFGRTVETGENAANVVAKNHISGLRLQQQLAYEEVETLFDEKGELTQAAIRNSRRIPLKINNPELKKILSERGNLTDWGKYETTPVHTNAGLARMHFYHNPVTGEAYYDRDYKAVFDHQGKWNFDMRKNFTMYLSN